MPTEGIPRYAPAVMTDCLAVDLEDRRDVDRTAARSDDRSADSDSSDEVARSLRFTTDASWRHTNGIYFTGDELATSLWEPILQQLNESSVVIDPACGAASLLLPAVRELRRAGKNASPEYQVRGYDIEPSFITISRNRMMAACAGPGLLEENFVVADFLRDPIDLKSATHVVMNPPFNPMVEERSTGWSSGSVNSAAVFVLHALRKMSENAMLLAILPDVLRSGSRYRRWREEILRHGVIESIEVADTFDAFTDVHIFILRLRRTSSPRPTAPGVGWSAACNLDRTLAAPERVIGDTFQVSVGSVVPHRHEDVGSKHPYLDSTHIRGKRRLAEVIEVRGFSGRLHQAPFIVVRRTSRPEQAPRMKATLVASNQMVAVENHLIVLRPRDGLLATCEKHLVALEGRQIDAHLNREIRLRHLTVGAVANTPLQRIDA
ncbi:N-6 DNA methylase [Curtobacterium sp. ME12]|uniref:N-6 DNA methylase n=1 Tax=Curtobacterium sp. ME12 TaxID=2744253 RepID=UPI0015F641C9|nr:N-6 DNA methylase [Curtobacterium sp. ME12]